MNNDNDLFLKKALELAGDFEPIDPPNDEDWDRTERDIGWRLPAEHKRFVSHFGSGRFGDDFYMLNPKAKGAGRLNAEALRGYSQRKRRSLSKLSRPIFPESSLLLIATTTSGVDCFVDASQPEGLILFDLDLSKHFELSMSFPEFVYKLYTDQLSQNWAGDLRQSIWSSSDARFFKPMSNL